MTFLKALTGAETDGLAWAPEGVSDQQRQIAIAAANSAAACPFAVTRL